MTRLAIVGAGDLGRQLAHLATLLPDLEVAGFFDDASAAGVTTIAPVLGPLDAVATCYRDGAFDALAMGLGYRRMGLRTQLFDELSAKIPFVSLIHPSAMIDPTVKLGRGVVVYAGCVIDAGAVIEDNVLLNVGCVIAHDSRIGRGCFLSPAVAVAGFATIGMGSTLGIGTRVVDRMTIAGGVRTGAGAVVTKPIVRPGLHVGMPAAFKRDQW